MHKIGFNTLHKSGGLKINKDGCLGFIANLFEKPSSLRAAQVMVQVTVLSRSSLESLVLARLGDDW
jgi:hypothetical protein